MIYDSFSPILESLKERMKNSISGPYTFFFFAYNWRILIYVLTGEHASDWRVEEVKNYISSNGSLFVLGAPFLQTIFYLIAMPFLIGVYTEVKAWLEMLVPNRVNRERINQLSEARDHLTKVSGNIDILRGEFNQISQFMVGRNKDTFSARLNDTRAYCDHIRDILQSRSERIKAEFSKRRST